MTAIFNGIIHIEGPLSQSSQNYPDKCLRSLGQAPMEHPTHGQVKFMSMHGQAWDCMPSRKTDHVSCRRLPQTRFVIQAAAELMMDLVCRSHAFFA